MNEKQAINLLVDAVNAKRESCISRRKELKKGQKFIDSIRNERLSVFDLKEPLQKLGISHPEVESLLDYFLRKGKDFSDTDSSIYQRVLSSIDDLLTQKEEELKQELESLDSELSLVSKYKDEDSIMDNLKSLGELLEIVELPDEVADDILVTMAKVSIKKAINMKILKAQFDELSDRCNKILAQKESLNFEEDDEKIKAILANYSPETREKVMDIYDSIKHNLMNNYNSIAGAYSYIGAYFENARTTNSIEFLSDMIEELEQQIKANAVHFKRYERITSIEPMVYEEEEELTEEVKPVLVIKEDIKPAFAGPVEEEPVVVEPVKEESFEEENVEIAQPDEKSMIDLAQDVVEILGNNLYAENDEKTIFERYKASVLDAKRILSSFNDNYEYLPSNGSDIIKAIRDLGNRIKDITEIRADNEIFGGPKEDLQSLFGGIIEDINSSIAEIKENLDYCLETNAIPQRVYNMFFPTDEIEEEVVEEELFQDDGTYGLGPENLIIFAKNNKGKYVADNTLNNIDAGKRLEKVDVLLSGLNTFSHESWSKTLQQKGQHVIKRNGGRGKAKDSVRINEKDTYSYELAGNKDYLAYYVLGFKQENKEKLEAELGVKFNAIIVIFGFANAHDYETLCNSVKDGKKYIEKIDTLMKKTDLTDEDVKELAKIIREGSEYFESLAHLRDREERIQ